MRKRKHFRLQLERLEVRHLLASILVEHTDAETVVDERGMMDAIEVVLDTEPASNVVLQVMSVDSGEVIVSPDQLVFAPGDWDQPQIVSITGVDDDEVDGAQQVDILVSVDVNNSDASYADAVDFVLQVENQDDHEIRELTGTFTEEIESLKEIAVNSDRYVAPSIPADVPDGTSEIERFAELAVWLRSGDLDAAAPRADQLNYEIVTFVDSPTVFGLLERLDDQQKQTKGWGSYFWDNAGAANSLVEVPHPIHDTRSGEIGAIAFSRSNSLGFLMAGAHRDTGPNGTEVDDIADVAHLEHSIFQEVHKAWSLPAIDVWQIHGFDLDKRPADWPQEMDAIVSTGEDIGVGYISPQIVSLDRRLENANWETYVYAQGHHREPCVNEDQPGIKFDDLAATLNLQGDYSRSVGSEFIHIELEQSVRLNGPANRLIAGNLIGDEIASEHQVVELTLANPAPVEAAGIVAGVLTRLGGGVNELIVPIASDSPGTVSVPSEVQLPANQDVVQVQFSIHDDGVIEDDELVTIELDNADFATCGATLLVRDDDTPVLQVLNVQLNAGLNDPLDLPKGPQPSSWASQRSSWQNVEITFSHEVSVSQEDIRLTNLGVNSANDDDVVVDLDGKLAVNGQQLTLVLQDDLADGVYRLEIHSTLTSTSGLLLDGNGDGVGGDGFRLDANEANNFYRLTADWNGDEGVSVFDFSAFSYWFGTTVPEAPAYMDINRDQGVSVFDFSGFSSNFGMGVEFEVGFVIVEAAARREPNKGTRVQQSRLFRSSVSREDERQEVKRGSGVVAVARQEWFRAGDVADLPSGWELESLGLLDLERLVLAALS